MLPEPLRNRIEEQLGQGIRSLQPSAGGSINQAAVLSTGQNERYFLKWNSSADPAMFEKETRGLQLLTGAKTGLMIPGTFGFGTAGETTGYLLMEHIDQGTAGPESAIEFGRGLAALHRTKEDRFGLDHDNFIGRLPQSNRWHGNWIDFFIEERLEPQLRAALSAGRIHKRVISSFDQMYGRLQDLLPDEPASLLHGDLWGGNYFFNTEGEPVIYDPAVYYGNREIELAFTYLFGGFPRDFYRAYQEAWPLQPEFESRKDIYNLYPLLVHTNLFGGHYGRQVESIVKQFN